jgi:hypothetical protein
MPTAGTRKRIMIQARLEYGSLLSRKIIVTAMIKLTEYRIMPKFGIEKKTMLSITHY